MATLEKKNAVKIFTDSLIEIYENNNFRFPDRFDDFGYEIAKIIYDRFKFIEGNPIVFEKTMGLDELPLKMNNSFELVERD